MAANSLRDSIPPHNKDAEVAVLGAMFLDNEAVAVVDKYLKIDDFYSLQNQKIYSAIISLYNKNERPDIISVTAQLRSTEELESAGGPAYIASLTDTVPTTANVEYYAALVQETALKRSLIKAANTMIAESHDDSKETGAIIQQAQSLIMDLSDKHQSVDFKWIHDILPGVFDNIEMLYKTKNPFTGVPSGLETLDEITNGFQPSEMTIIGARPSIGKTALALSMAANIAFNAKIPVGFLSLEMSANLLIKRFLSMESNVPSEKLRSGMLSPAQVHTLINTTNRIYESPLYIADTPNMRLMDIRTTARKMKLKHNIQILFIDYIGLITHENFRMQRFEQVSEISRTLKGLARELDIPIVVLSQVGRGAEGQPPTLNELRDSGSIEQDADVVMFLHRERLVDPVDGKIPTDLIIAKQRNGPLGLVPLDFIPNLTRFVSGSTSRSAQSSQKQSSHSENNKNTDK